LDENSKNFNERKTEEQNKADALIEPLQKPYTQKLINAVTKGI